MATAEPVGGPRTQGRRRSRSRVVVAVVVAALLGLGAVACSSDDDDSSSTGTSGAPGTTAAPAAQEIRIGALLSVTGGGSTLGTTSEAALELAVERWNDKLASEGGDVQVVLQVEDTELDPDLAMAGFERLVEWGAQVVIGPQSSSEVAAIEDLADEHGVLVVSQGSTASSLAADDNVFRFVPNDKVEGRAITDLMVGDGVSTIVPVWREDRGNQGLVDSVRESAAASGVTVVEGVRYPATTTDFAPVVAGVQAALAAVTPADGSSGVGVYLAGFEEVADIFALLSQAGDLGQQVGWYGGDGSAKATALVTTPGSGDFALSVGGYPSPLLALPAERAAADAALIDEITSMAGSPADAFTLAAYDAFDVAVQAILDAGVDAGVADLRSAFLQVADGFEGVTGVIELDAGGDRTSGPFDFWSICPGPNGPAWTLTGSWAPAANPLQPGVLTTGGCEQAAG